MGYRPVAGGRGNSNTGAILAAVTTVGDCTTDGGVGVVDQILDIRCSGQTTRCGSLDGILIFDKITIDDTRQADDDV